MKVGLSTSLLEPSLNPLSLDGIGVYTKHIYTGLRERNVDVAPYAFYSSPFRLENSSIHSLPVGQSFAVAAAKGIMTNGLAKVKVDVDLFHATDQCIVPMSCPVVATLYDAIPFIHPDWASQRFRGLRNFVKKRVAGFADHVIAISHFCVEEISHYYEIPTERISVVYCGVDAKWLTEPHADAVADVLRKRNLRAGYFLSVGTLQPRKNVERIIDAYLSLPVSIQSERQLLVVGRQGWRCQELAARLSRLSSEGKLIWLEDVSSFDELRMLYSGAGAFVFPSLYEGFGLPLVEAFACGLPAIISNTTSLPEISMGAAIEVSPESVVEIAEAMHTLAVDESMRKRLSLTGRARADDLTWQKTVEGVERVYRALL